jgi:hypothetical protein
MSWDVFISHASEDKETVARPLARLLSDAGLRVWLDADALEVGDSLRAKIDQGLAGSRFVVLVLSPAFFHKDWTTRELNGVSALDSAFDKKVLPVWHGVDRAYVAHYSPTLADKHAVSTDEGLDGVAAKLLRVVSPASAPAPTPAPDAAPGPGPPGGPQGFEGEAARRPFGVRLWSTPASIRAGEMTWLAMAETAVAVALSVYVTVRTGTLFYSVAAASLAPLLLLRTLRSVRLNWSMLDGFFEAGQSWLLGNTFERGIRFVARSQLLGILLFIILFIIIFSYISFTLIVTRFLSTTWAVLRAPAEGARAVPGNWYRVALCTDTAFPPEVVAGVEEAEPGQVEKYKSIKYFKSSKLLSIFIDEIINFDVIEIIFQLFVYTMYVPPAASSLAYRLSLKSSTLFYLPLVWAVRWGRADSRYAAGRPGEYVRARVSDLLYSPWERFSRWYSWFVLVALNGLPLAAFPVFHVKWRQLADQVSVFAAGAVEPRVGEVLRSVYLFVTPDRIEVNSSHLARLIGAAITVWLFVLAERTSRRLRDGIWSADGPEGRLVSRKIWWGVAVRRWLGLWSAFCALAIVWQSVRWSDLPAFVIRWLPGK